MKTRHTTHMTLVGIAAAALAAPAYATSPPASTEMRPTHANSSNATHSPVDRARPKPDNLCMMSTKIPAAGDAMKMGDQIGAVDRGLNGLYTGYRAAHLLVDKVVKANATADLVNYPARYAHGLELGSTGGSTTLAISSISAARASN